MTIVAGFPGKDFVVLGADSEETSAITKGSVRKIARVERDSWKCIIGGAGDGDFIDLAVQEADEALPDTANHKQIRVRLEEIVSEIYASRIDHLPPAEQERADFDLLCASWVKDSGVQMFKVRRLRSLILVKPTAIGFGSYLANYMMSAFAVTDQMDFRRSIRMATYIVAQVKAHAKYCGGSSQIVAIRSDGSISETQLKQQQMDENSAQIAMMGASMLVHLADPMAYGFNLDMLDKAIDATAAKVKEIMHQHFDAEAEQFKQFVNKAMLALLSSQEATKQQTAQPSPATPPSPGLPTLPCDSV